VLMLMGRQHVMVNMPKSVLFCNWTPICEWYVVKCSSKNGYQTNMCSIEIQQCAQSMITNFHLRAKGGETHMNIQ
jgi:hypothetical protein